MTVIRKVICNCHVTNYPYLTSKIATVSYMPYSPLHVRFLIDYMLATDLFYNSRKHSMADSPAIQTLVDPEEQPILESILRVRDNLQLLKEDKSTYVKSQDVLALYHQVIEQVNLLNVIREEHGKPSEQNRGPLSILQIGMIGRKPELPN